MKYMKTAKLNLTKITGKKILAIGAHSDDVEFAAGGTLLQLGVNNDLRIIVATDGRLGVHEFDADAEALVKKRIEESRMTGEKMGAKKVTFWLYPDWGLEERRKHLIKKVVKTVLRERPDIIISLDPWGKYELYVHPDHRTLAWAVQEGIMLATLPRWVQLHRLGRRMLHPKPQTWLMWPGEVNGVADVSGVWERKIDLIGTFVSQFDDHFQKEEVLAWVEQMAQENGAGIGVEKGEAFRILDYKGEWNSSE